MANLRPWRLNVFGFGPLGLFGIWNLVFVISKHQQNFKYLWLALGAREDLRADQSEVNEKEKDLLRGFARVNSSTSPLSAERKEPMPFVNIKIYEGHGKERKDQLAARVTDAIAEVTKLPREAIWVVIEEIDPPDWYVGGKPGERKPK